MVKVVERLHSNYVDSSRYAALERLIAEVRESGDTLDITDARFVPNTVSLLSPAYNTGVKIVGGPKLLMDMLEENKRRSLVDMDDYPNVLTLPTTSVADAIHALEDIQTGSKWRANEKLISNNAYIMYVAMAFMYRYDIELCLGSLTYFVINMLSPMCAELEGDSKYYCICNSDVQVVERGEDGKFDMGKYGLIDEDTFRIRFKAVPYYIGTQKMTKEVKEKIFRTLLNKLAYTYTTNKAKSLYAFICGKDK